MPLARDLAPEPLRAAPWSLVVSVLNTCDRPRRTNLAADRT